MYCKFCFYTSYANKRNSKRKKHVSKMNNQCLYCKTYPYKVGVWPQSNSMVPVNVNYQFSWGFGIIFNISKFWKLIRYWAAPCLHPTYFSSVENSLIHKNKLVPFIDTFQQINANMHRSTENWYEWIRRSELKCHRSALGMHSRHHCPVPIDDGLPNLY